MLPTLESNTLSTLQRNPSSSPSKATCPWSNTNQTTTTNAFTPCSTAPVNITQEEKTNLNSNLPSSSSSSSSGLIYRSPPKVPSRLSPLYPYTNKATKVTPTSTVSSSSFFANAAYPTSEMNASRKTTPPPSTLLIPIPNLMDALENALNPNMVPTHELLTLLSDLQTLFTSGQHDYVHEFMQEGGISFFPTLFQHPDPQVLYALSFLLTLIVKHSNAHHWITQELVNSILATLSPCGLDVPTTLHLLYVLGQLTQTLSQVHSFLIPHKNKILDLFVCCSMDFMKNVHSNSNITNEDDAVQVLIRLLRLLANLFLDTHLGFHWASDARLLILLDLLPETYSNYPLLYSFVILAIHNHTYHLQGNVLFTRGKDLIQMLIKFLQQEDHPNAPEIIGISANLSRDTKKLPVFFDSNVLSFLTSWFLKEHQFHLLVPLCGLWTNLVNFESGVNALKDHSQRLMELLSLAIENQFDPLLEIWCKLILNLGASSSFYMPVLHRDFIIQKLNEAKKRKMHTKLLEVIVMSFRLLENPPSDLPSE